MTSNFCTLCGQTFNEDPICPDCRTKADWKTSPGIIEIKPFELMVNAAIKAAEERAAAQMAEMILQMKYDDGHPGGLIGHYMHLWRERRGK